MAAATTPTKPRRREIELEDLAGLEAREAIDRLRALELRPAVEACEVAEHSQHGVVLTHDPAAAAIVHRGQLVTLLVGQHTRASQPPAVDLPAEVSAGLFEDLGDPGIATDDQPPAERDLGAHAAPTAAAIEPVTEPPALSPTATAPLTSRHKRARAPAGKRAGRRPAAVWVLAPLLIVAAAASLAFTETRAEHPQARPTAPAPTTTTTPAVIATPAVAPSQSPPARRRPVSRRPRPVLPAATTHPAAVSAITRAALARSSSTTVTSAPATAVVAATPVTQRAPVVSSPAAAVSLPPSPTGPLSAPPPNQTTPGGQP